MLPNSRYLFSAHDYELDLRPFAWIDGLRLAVSLRIGYRSIDLECDGVQEGKALPYGAGTHGPQSGSFISNVFDLTVREGRAQEIHLTESILQSC